MTRNKENVNLYGCFVRSCFCYSWVGGRKRLYIISNGHKHFMHLNFHRAMPLWSTEMRIYIYSNIRHKYFCLFASPSPTVCHIQATPLDTSMWWTGELWSKSCLLKWLILNNIIFLLTNYHPIFLHLMVIPKASLEYV